MVRKRMELIVKADSASMTDIVPIVADVLPEFEFDREDAVSNIDSLYDVSVHIKGELVCEESLMADAEEDMRRLTHHAEALYADTDYEYVHIEVCIDGIWFGRA